MDKLDLHKISTAYNRADFHNRKFRNLCETVLCEFLKNTCEEDQFYCDGKNGWTIEPEDSYGLSTLEMPRLQSMYLENDKDIVFVIEGYEYSLEHFDNSALFDVINYISEIENIKR